MIRTALASFTARPLALTFAAALSVAAFAPAQADPSLPASAQSVRTTLIALSAADAAMPFATAAATATESATVLPSSAALKPDTANAMAAVRTAAVRRVEPAVVERRIGVRPYRDPFFLATGIAY